MCLLSFLLYFYRGVIEGLSHSYRDFVESVTPPRYTTTHKKWAQRYNFYFICASARAQYLQKCALLD